MNERMIHRIEIIETEDGFRIELKGDKEILRRMIFAQNWLPVRKFGVQRHDGEHTQEHHQHQRHEFRAHHPFHGRKHPSRGQGSYDLGPWWDEKADSNDMPSDNKEA